MYNDFSDYRGIYLEHYGVKGMKWDESKKSKHAYTYDPGSGAMSYNSSSPIGVSARAAATAKNEAMRRQQEIARKKKKAAQAVTGASYKLTALRKKKGISMPKANPSNNPSYGTSHPVTKKNTMTKSDFVKVANSTKKKAEEEANKAKKKVNKEARKIKKKATNYAKRYIAENYLK